MPTDPKSMELVLTHRSELIGYALRILGNRTVAEDIVQEAYLKFWAHTAVPDEAPEIIAEPVGYLYRIVRNLAFDWHRKPSSTLTTHMDGEDLDRIATTDASPEADAMWRQELAAVQNVIDTLPERTRIAFEMHRLGGKTLQEVADHLDVSVTRAHQLIKQALLKCAACLDEIPAAEKTNQNIPRAPEKKRGSHVSKRGREYAKG